MAGSRNQDKGIYGYELVYSSLLHPAYKKNEKVQLMSPNTCEKVQLMPISGKRGIKS